MTRRPDEAQTRIFTGGSIYGYKKTVENIDRQGFTELESSQAFENEDGQQEFCGVRSNDDFWFNREFDRSAQEYSQLALLNMTQVNVDVSSAPLQTIEERLCKDVAKAQARLEVYKDDRAALESRAVAHFWLHDYENSIADLNTLLAEADESPKRPSWLLLRARARARLGKTADARADLEACQQLNPSPVELMVAETMVSAAAGRVEPALEKLEASLAKHSNSDEYLHRGAMVYSLISELVRPRDARQASQLATRALELLGRAFDAGLDAYLAVAYEPHFAPLRNATRFHELLAPGLLELRYAAIWRSSPTHVAVEAHDLDPAAHLKACRRFAEMDYRPLVMSATYLPNAGKLIAASVWLQPRVTEAEDDAHARRTANAALALLRLGTLEPVWSILEHSENPSARSYVIDRCSAEGVDPEILLERLEREERVSVSRAGAMSERLRRAASCAAWPCDQAIAGPVR